MKKPHSLMRTCLFRVLFVIAGGVVCGNVDAEEKSGLVAKATAIFEQRCVRCHSTGTSKGELSLSTRAEFFKGGESGELIVPGKPDESLLIDMVAGDSPSMPAEGEPLTPAQVATLRQWIATGAEWPESLVLTEKIPGGRDWWSFQPIVRPVVPDVKKREWLRTEVDSFILNHLEQKTLSPSQEADRRTLIRRLSFDLLGLPPTFEEIEAFVADTDPLAYEKRVDRMLASPHYGERWARHWLDIAHYADTHGFERDQRRDHAWRYRDYVIRSFNDDKPYHEFLREQIAGDVLRPDDPVAVVATGFLAAGPWDFVGQVETGSPALKRAARADDLDDMVTQVMTSSVGLTVNCARCHDHKLDPISQQEYYQLWSVFAGVRRGDRESNPAEGRRIEALKQELLAEQATIRARQAVLRGTPIHLAKIAGGGDGRGTTKPGAGVDPVTGKLTQTRRGYLEGFKLNNFITSSVRFVDGVVVPDASEEGTIISSTGIRIQNVPKTSGQVWDAIRFGPVNSQFSTKLGGIDFASEGHSLLALHANVAITFDLKELRETGAPGEMKLTSTVGYFGQTAQAGASVSIYLDGALKFQRLGLGRDDGLVPIQIDLPENARFLTLMATDNGNGISHDQIGFGDPFLSPTRPAELNEEQQAELSRLDQRLKQLELEFKNLPAPERFYGVTGDAAPPVVHRLHRGDPEQPREEVGPGALSCVAGLSSELSVEGNSEGARRVALANWITDPANPLTRRVIVNRLWRYHFGVGLVETPSDFGYGGGRPSHPELLDYLADELLAQGWSLKTMHKLICTSAVYRQQSTDRRDHEMSLDSDNRLLWRMNSRRLDAESLWDATLSVTGNLNTQMYGPGFRDFDYTEAYAPIYRHKTADSPELWRRAVYRFIVRSTPHQLMSTLDCPNPANLTPTRNVTTTALQSLAMLNNDFLLRQSACFAERVKQNAGDSVQEQVQLAFRLALGRNPTNAETRAALELLKTNSLSQLCRMILNANEFVYID